MEYFPLSLKRWIEQKLNIQQHGTADIEKNFRAAASAYVPNSFNDPENRVTRITYTTR